MNLREIIPSVYYVGVNDRTTTLFESLWPLPYGVSYNSYLVKGEKVALIDTVKIDKLKDFLFNLDGVLGGRKIDYLIVNHMEPDHSGSIPEILLANPGMKIVGNRQTIGMIKGYYEIEDDSVFHEVKDGDTLNLGGKTLKFVLTPMVHWPETMVTYLVEDRTLFSGDAFGTFGALNGAVVDDDMDIDLYIREMYRYYSNIVGKYGKFVQAALKKLDGVELDYICSTHGPVWHSHIKEVYDIVDRLSRYESEPGVVIIYGSMYGNTELVAEQLAMQLSIKGVRSIKVHDASRSSMSDMISDAFRYSALVVASPTYSMHLLPPVETFMIAMQTRDVKNKVFATFGNYTWAPLVNKLLKEYSDRMGWTVVGDMMIKMSEHEEDKKNVEALAEKIVDAMKASGK